jgi:hypothetical protein
MNSEDATMDDIASQSSLQSDYSDEEQHNKRKKTIKKQKTAKDSRNKQTQQKNNITTASNGSNNDNSNTNNIQLEDAENGQFLTADSTDEWVTVAKTGIIKQSFTAKHPIAPLFFPTSITRDDTVTKIKDVDVIKWMTKHQLDINYGIKEVKRRGAKYWKVPIIKDLMDKVQQLAGQGGSSDFHPEWEDLNTSIAEGYEEYLVTGIMPGDDKITNDAIILQIQGIFEMLEINYQPFNRVGWSKDRTERNMVVHLAEEDEEKIARINKDVFYVMGHCVRVYKTSDNFVERVKKEDLRTFLMHNLSPNMTGQSLEGIRKTLKAKYVRIPGIRLKHSHKLVKGKTAHFIFEEEQGNHIQGHLDGMGLIIDNRTYHLRPMMADGKRRHSYCYHCGHPGHYIFQCPRRQYVRERQEEKVSAFLEGRMTGKKEKSFAEAVTASIAKGKSIIPNNYSAYALAAKRGALVDLDGLKSEMTSKGKESPMKHYKDLDYDDDDAGVMEPQATSKPKGSSGPQTNKATNNFDNNMATLEAKFAEQLADLKKLVEKEEVERKKMEATFNERIAKMEEKFSAFLDTMTKRDQVREQQESINTKRNITMSNNIANIMDQLEHVQLGMKLFNDERTPYHNKRDNTKYAREISPRKQGSAGGQQ